MKKILIAGAFALLLAVLFGACKSHERCPAYSQKLVKATEAKA
jgi:hypothetical protein